MSHLLMEAVTYAVSIPNPAPANDPDIQAQASKIISLVKLGGILAGSIVILCGGALLWSGNRSSNQVLSVTGRGFILSGIATLIAMPVVIPVINRFFV